MKKLLLWLILIVLLIGIAWFTWSQKLREPEIKDVFTPALIEPITIDPRAGKWDGK